MANISKIKLPSGVTYDVVDEKSGYITSASLPTKTSDLTNDSGFITSYTDTKNTAGSTYTSSQLYLIGAMTQEENPQTYSNSNLYYYNGLVSRGEYQNYISDINQTGDQIGLYTIDQSSGNENGVLIDSNGVSIYSDSGHVAISGLVTPTNNTDAVNKKYVDDSIAAIPAASITLNGTSTTSASFYAPTAVGNSGQYLKSNGSGAPTWVEPPDLSEYVEWISLSSSSVPTTFTNDTISFDWDATTYSDPDQNVQWALERIIYEIDEVGNAKADSNVLASVAISGSYNDLLNANWLNGSATGSVRTNGSTVEDSNYTIGNYAVAEGQGTKASGNYSHAEGRETTASSADSHAEGLTTTASAIAAHAEGHGTTASSLAAHAEGQNTTASGKFSHAGGTYTTAQRKSQTVIGEYNILDTVGTTTTRGDYAFIIGNGTDDNARSNALAIKWDGTVETAKGNLSGVQIVRW